MQLASNKTQPIIGGDFTRIDGPLKVSGTATYTSDVNLPGTLYAVPVCATIAKGRITHLDTAAAAGMPGSGPSSHARTSASSTGSAFRST